MASDTKALAIFQEMQKTLEPFPASKFHHLVPTTFQEMSALFRPAASVVSVNANDARDVYPTPGGASTVCLHSQALERIGNAIGIDWNETKYEHDHAKEPLLCAAFASGWITDSLGQRRRLSASAKSDLRDGSVTARVLGRGVETARQFICERTESRARNRAIKKIANIPTSFTKEELAKPFVAIRFRLDETDPDVKKALIAQGTGAADVVFGREAAPIDAGASSADDEVIEGHAREIEDEPEILDEKQPEQPPQQAKTRTAADVVAEFKKSVRTYTGQDDKATPEALSAYAYLLRDALELGTIGISKEDLGALRRSMSTFLFGVRSVNELSAAHIAVVRDAAKTPAGVADLRAAFTFLLEQDKALASILSKLAK